MKDELGKENLPKNTCKQQPVISQNFKFPPLIVEPATALFECN